MPLSVPLKTHRNRPALPLTTTTLPDTKAVTQAPQATPALQATSQSKEQRSSSKEPGANADSEQPQAPKQAEVQLPTDPESEAFAAKWDLPKDKHKEAVRLLAGMMERMRAEVFEAFDGTQNASNVTVKYKMVGVDYYHLKGDAKLCSSLKERCQAAVLATLGD